MKCILIFLLFLLTSNLIAQENTIIPYILNIQSEKAIYDHIEFKDKDSISFLLEHLDGNKFKIHLTTIDSRFAKSNRKLFVNDRFYPLYFRTDDSFYVELINDFPVVSKMLNDTENSEIPIPSIAERLKDQSSYWKTRIYTIIDLSAYWIINEKGQLLETNIR